ncbi:MAG: SsrA-binding protein SmpB [Candidatus Gracilibacteria bacterium]|nr:SsrA-binding protein SmpB [Candidatus Gracilibacteria bacterium]
MKNNKNNDFITKNKKAYFDYEILNTYEAGIELKGYEVKSIRQGHVNLKGSYIVVVNGELYVKSMNVSPWKTLSNKTSIEADRIRKIFLHKKDVLFLSGKSKEVGFSIIPLELYFVGSLIKLRVGLAKGRKSYDKKQVLKERTMDREAKIAMKKYI